MTDITSLITTGAILAASGTIVYQLKSIPKMIYTKIKQRLIYTVKVYQYDELFEYLEKWLSTNHNKAYRDVEACVSTNNLTPEPVTTKTPPPVLSYKQEETTFFLKYKGKKILISKSKEKIEKATSIKEIFFRRYSLSGLRARTQIDALLKEVISEAMKERIPNTIRVYSSTSYGEWTTGPTIKVKPMEKVILPPYIMDNLNEDIQKFLSSEDWYSDVSVPYKRGYCFYGPPGTGKTTLALAIANMTRRNVYCLNLNALENDSRLPQVFSYMKDNSILLIEDIDKVFSGRENVKEDTKVSFSSLLNCLDGAFYKQGLITIITTNHIEKLDPALLRTGRIDMKLEVCNPTCLEISRYLSLFYSTPISISGSYNLKMSDIQEICISNRSSLTQALKQIYDSNNLPDTSNKEGDIAEITLRQPYFL